jgi:hypothetical protein
MWHVMHICHARHRHVIGRHRWAIILSIRHYSERRRRVIWIHCRRWIVLCGRMRRIFRIHRLVIIHCCPGLHSLHNLVRMAAFNYFTSHYLWVTDWIILAVLLLLIVLVIVLIHHLLRYRLSSAKRRVVFEFVNFIITRKSFVRTVAIVLLVGCCVWRSIFSRCI